VWGQTARQRGSGRIPQRTAHHAGEDYERTPVAAYSLKLAAYSMKIQSFKELIVWQRAMELVREVYKASAKLPNTEMYGLTNQMRRCAVSIPSNIAEGRKRGTQRDFTQFLRIADGSAAELETQILLACDLYQVKEFERSKELLSEVQKMLGAIIRTFSLQAASYKLPARKKQHA